MQCYPTPLPNLKMGGSFHDAASFNRYLHTKISVDHDHTDRSGHQDGESSSPEHETVWHLLSHDAFAPAEAVAFQEREPPPHIAAYKISTAMRSGMGVFPVLTFSCVVCLKERGESQLFYQPKSRLPYLPAVSPLASFGASLL